MDLQLCAGAFGQSLHCLRRLLLAMQRHAWCLRQVRGLRKHMRATQVADQELKKSR